MAKFRDKSARDCKSIASSDPGESKDAPTGTLSTSQGSGGRFVYGIFTVSPESMMWYWTISTASNVLTLRADEYPCIP